MHRGKEDPKGEKQWIELEVLIASKNKDFLEGASINLMNALDNPYFEAGIEKHLNRIFSSSIEQYFIVKKERYVPEKDDFWILFIKPIDKYDVNSLKKDIRALYQIIKDVSIAAGYGWEIDYSLEIDKQGILIVTQNIGFLKMSYPLKNRVYLFMKDPDSDFLCFIDDSLAKVFPKLISLAKKSNKDGIKQELTKFDKIMSKNNH